VPVGSDPGVVLPGDGRQSYNIRACLSITR